MNKKILLSAGIVIIIVIAAIFAVGFLKQSFTDQNLKLMITPDRATYAKGETINIHGQIKNLSKQELYFYTTESSLVPTFKIFDPQGHEIEALYAIDDPPLPELKDFVLIRSGESLSKEFRIFIPEENIKSSGMYSITTIYDVRQDTYFDNHKQVELNAWTGTLKSNTIKVEIKFNEEQNPKPVANDSKDKLPEVTLLSPTGGEVWTSGNFYTVRWAPLPKTLIQGLQGTDVHVQVWLVGTNGAPEAQASGALGFSKDSFQETEYYVSLTSVNSGLPLELPPGKYKVQLRFFDMIPARPCGIIDPSRPPCVPRDETNYGMIAKGISDGLITLESKK